MEKEKSRMKRVLASALLLSMCSLQLPASARYVYNATSPVNGSFTESNTSNVTGGSERGGIIFMDDKSSALNIESINFEKNSITSPGWADGGAIALRNGTINITGGKFSENYADLGGALSQSAKLGYTSNPNVSKYIISGATFDKNTAKAGGAAGFFNEVSISNSVFSNNKDTIADDGGGAIFLGSESSAYLSEVTFSTNETMSNGGAIAMRDFIQGNNSSAKLDINNSTFTGNIAAGKGGAIYNTFFNSTQNPSYVTIKGGSFTGNQATNGGAIYNDALDNSSEISSAIINNVTFSGNIASESGSAIFTKGGLTIENSTFTDNVANGSGYAGGAIKVNAKGSEVKISNSEFSGNKADNGYAGAIYHSYGDVTLDEVTFTSNSANGSGAVMQGTQAGLLTITNSDFTSNTSNKAGGAIGIFKKAEITDTDFTSNTNTASGEALEGGGAMFLGSWADLRLENVNFTSNKVGSDTVVANGGAIGMRDFVNGDNSDAKLDIINTNFANNTATGNGGAIYNTFFNSVGNPNFVTIEGGSFTGNKAVNGGAIYNDASDTSSEISSAIIKNATFSGNIASESGSAIFTKGGLTIENSKFTDNVANGSGYAGGAIKVNATGSEVKISNSEFSGNKADNGYGGAIYHSLGNVTLDNVTFTGNSANGSGAVMQGTQAGTLTIQNSLFEGNTSNKAGGALGIFHGTSIENSQFINNTNTASGEPLEGGGAIFLGSVSSLAAFNNVLFDGNTSGSDGGAIGMRDPNSGNNTAAKISLDGVTFTNNVASRNGGAIQNTFRDVTISNATFSNNSAGQHGGAIYNEVGGSNSKAALISINDSSFTNNTASGLGGAIYANSDVYINAIASNVTFSGNTDKNGANDIYMAGADSTLYLNATEGQQLVIGSGVDGDDYKIIINSGTTKAPSPTRLYAMRASSGSSYGGTVVIGGAVAGADIEHTAGVLKLSEVTNVDESTISVASGATLDTINGKIEEIGSNITLADGAELKVDLDASGNAGDDFSEAAVQGDVVISEINTLGSTDETDLSQLNIAQALGLGNTNVTISQAAMDQTYTVMTPIRKMNGIIDQNGMMTFAPTGNSYKDFNPAVMAAPVAAQLGGYLTQLNAYNQAFHNMDMYMLMTSSQRKALKMAGRVASSSLVGGVEAAHKDNNMWFNPYASYEKVGLNHGPKVENTGYGMFFGGETDLKDLGHGWDGVFGAYVGYNGSHQSYDGVSIYQNGGSLGLVGMAYKDNFFTGLTINSGANAASANTRFGDEDFAMLMAGIASKSGYNFEFKDGKVILQPSLLMSYTMVNTFDYDNGANVSITSDALHAFQIEPGLKVIGNLKNGWQPYAGVSVVWNLFDKAKFQANDVSLPQISVKPYVKYGVGVRKSWGERLTGFFQTYVTNGGRNGVGFQAGFSFAIGKDSGSKVNTAGRLPEIKKLELSLKNANHS